jgi:hypothetical protein
MVQAARSGNPAKRAVAKKAPAKKTAAPTAKADVTINADVKKKIIVDLVGEKYSVTPPKTSLAIKVTQRARGAEGKPTRKEADESFEALQEWIDKAFGVQGAKRVRTRLNDADDDLDLDQIMQLMNVLLEMESGGPST